MKQFLTPTLALATLLSLGTTSASAATACSFSDLTNVTVTACTGLFEGNLLSASPQDAAALAAALAPLTTTTTYSEKLLNSKEGYPDPSNIINFSTMLYGNTVIGLHFGGKDGGTGFYAFDAGTAGVDMLTVSAQLAGVRSGAAIFVTQAAPPDPRAGNLCPDAGRPRRAGHGGTSPPHRLNSLELNCTQAPHAGPFLLCLALASASENLRFGSCGLQQRAATDIRCIAQQDNRQRPAFCGERHRIRSRDLAVKNKQISCFAKYCISIKNPESQDIRLERRSYKILARI